jgi:hypothetical protein
MSKGNEPMISLQSGFSEAVASLNLEGALLDLTQEIFECCQPAISDSCTQLGGQTSQVTRQPLHPASLPRFPEFIVLV